MKLAACAAAAPDSRLWPKQLRALVFLGTPHHGAPLERAGHGVDLLLAASPHGAPSSAPRQLRSAGVRDLRHGCIHDPLPEGIDRFALAGSASKAEPRGGGAARGDGLVPIASALGRHVDRRLTLDLPPAHRYVAYGTGHLELLSSASVYARMRRWLTRRVGTASARAVRARHCAVNARGSHGA